MTKSIRMIVSFFMLIFSGLLLINTIQSENFSLEFMNKKAMILFILIFFLVCVAFINYKKILSFLINFHFLEHKKQFIYFSHGFLFLGIVIQIISLFVQPADMGSFDAGIIFEFNYHKHDRSDYFSQNPNNLLVYWLEMGIKAIVPFLSKGQFMTLLQIINVLIIASSLLIIFYVVENRFSLFVALIFYNFGITLLLFSPWVYVFYTDILCLLPISIILLLLTNIDRSSELFLEKKFMTYIIFCLKSFGVGILVGFAYLIKPTSIIFMIALFLTMLMFLNKKRFSKRSFLLFTCFLFLGIGTMKGSFIIFMKHQSLLQIDPSQAKPPTLFIMFGLKGKGGWNFDDAYVTLNHPTQREKIDMNLRVIKERLKTHGFLGYICFLVRKNYYNTSNGTFGWNKDERAYPRLPYSKNILARFIRENIFPDKKITPFYFLAQILWVIVAFFIFMFSLLSFGENNFYYPWLKLTIIGSLTFLLIFEGGRSRYLIQFLPFFLISAALGVERSWKLRRLL